MKLFPTAGKLLLSCRSIAMGIMAPDKANFATKNY